MIELIQIDTYRSMRVAHPTLREGNRHEYSGLSFYFRSDVRLELGDYVTAGGGNFQVKEMAVAIGGMGNPDSYIYRATTAGYFANAIDRKDDFDLAAFNGSSVEIITDEDQIKGIRRASRYT